MTVHNLANEPLLAWRDRNRRRHETTLPGILAKLASGELADFPRVRAHQLDAWCMFLTQLAAIALHRGGTTDPCQSEDEWRTLVVGLTAGALEPWSLVIGDLTKSAFLQPPVPERTIADWSVWEHPDDLDILVTSKGHDVKASLIAPDEIEAWVVALVTLQTMQGYPGRGYTRIARMKGGYGSRPRVGLAPDRTLSGRFLRDSRVLLDSWDAMVGRGFSDEGIALGWLEPWDGSKSLAMPDVSPHYIEICRRVRFVKAPAGVAAAYTTSTARRFLPEVEDGDTGDVWAPVERDGGVLTIGQNGFHYELMSRVLLGGDFEPAPAQTLRSDDEGATLLLASALARGQGKTEGLHERIIVIPPKLRDRLRAPDSRARLAVRALENVQQARKMRSKVLFPALRRIALDDKVPVDRFDARTDEIYFEHLFGFAEHDDEAAKSDWENALRSIASSELQSAINRCSVPSHRWFAVVSHAEGVFRSCLAKQFPSLAASLRKRDTVEDR